jgi:hypothetical protein
VKGLCDRLVSVYATLINVAVAGILIDTNLGADTGKGGTR